jgi:Mrp family chromosome partitioning ATPase
VAARRIWLRLAGDAGEGRTVSARMLELSRRGMRGSGGVAGVAPGTRVDVEMEVPWWGFARRLTVPGVIQRVSEDGSTWDLEFSAEDDATARRLERFVDRVHRTYRRLMEEGAGARLAEALRTVELGFGDSKAEGARVIVIGSAAPGEGKGSVAAGLSIVLAREGQPVLLVEADAESPALPGVFDAAKGLHEILAHEDSGEAIQNLSIPVWPSVHLLPAGSPRDADSSRIARAMGPWIARLRRSGFRYVVVNAPPLLRSVSGSVLAAAADDVFVVVRAAMSKERDLLEVRDLLTRARAPFRGIILTDESEEAPRGSRGGFWSAFLPRRSAEEAPRPTAAPRDERRFRATEAGS